MGGDRQARLVEVAHDGEELGGFRVDVGERLRRIAEVRRAPAVLAAHGDVLGLAVLLPRVPHLLQAIDEGAGQRLVRRGGDQVLARRRTQWERARNVRSEATKRLAVLRDDEVVARDGVREGARFRGDRRDCADAVFGCSLRETATLRRHELDESRTIFHMNPDHDGDVVALVGERSDHRHEEVELIERRDREAEQVVEKHGGRVRNERTSADRRADLLPSAVGMSDDQLAEKAVGRGDGGGPLGQRGIRFGRALAARGESERERKSEAKRAKLHGARSLPQFGGRADAPSDLLYQRESS